MMLKAICSWYFPLNVFLFPCIPLQLLWIFKVFGMQRAVTFDLVPLMFSIFIPFIWLCPLSLFTHLLCCTCILWTWVLYQVELKQNGFFGLGFGNRHRTLLGSFHICFICVPLYFSSLFYPPLSSILCLWCVYIPMGCLFLLLFF